jgi:hypothetical protein
MEPLELTWRAGDLPVGIATHQLRSKQSLPNAFELVFEGSSHPQPRRHTVEENRCARLV